MAPWNKGQDLVVFILVVILTPVLVRILQVIGLWDKIMAFVDPIVDSIFQFVRGLIP